MILIWWLRLLNSLCVCLHKYSGETKAESSWNKDRLKKNAKKNKRISKQGKISNWNKIDMSLEFNKTLFFPIFPTFTYNSGTELGSIFAVIFV